MLKEPVVEPVVVTSFDVAISVLVEDPVEGWSTISLADVVIADEVTEVLVFSAVLEAEVVVSTTVDPVVGST